jgi:hypothetical protein
VFRWKLGRTNILCRPSEGRSGRIALFWRTGVDVSLKSMSKYFTDVEVGRGANRWRFTGIYGDPRSDKDELTWKALRVLCHNSGRGCAWGILMKFCFNRKNKVVCQDHGSVWIDSEWRWRSVVWMI